MTTEDVKPLVDYFCRNTNEFYARLGIDSEKVPAPGVYTEHLHSLIDLAPEKAKSYYSIWLLNGKPVGHSSLKDIVYKDSGSQHLHVWKELERGKGYGPKWFCMSALDFYNRFQLHTVICEPRAENMLPNRMLQKVGFPLLSSRVAASSEISVVCKLNKYGIEREIAEKYLASR